MSGACGWVKFIVPSPGFETRWTREEKEQAAALKINVKKFCPAWGDAKWGQ